MGGTLPPSPHKFSAIRWCYKSRHPEGSLPSRPLGIPKITFLA